ncbi:DUF2339 domain-containing protein [Sulfurimonas sp. HSL1-6]|uniref:DUF2339 domain-containing protein n=1 Tax=Thiomicrolovo immobilis TaxID=3131935 RepID=UPI0031F79C44
MLTLLAILIIFFLILDLYKKNRELRERLDALGDGEKFEERENRERPRSPLEEVREKLVSPAVKPVVPNEQKAETLPRKEAAEGPVPETPKAAATETPQTEAAETSPLAQALNRFITGGNMLVKVGGIIFFLGLVFLVKYAAEHNMISIEMRLIGIALGALGMTALGWRLREREGYYGLVLQALGVASFYLVVYASAKMYGLLTMPQAFVIMLIVVICGSLLAVAQDAVILALFSITGGFLVPILTSDGSGSHIVLFSYYAMLNIGILLIAWYRSWRVLNIAGFFFTFVIATAWGVLRYEPVLFISTEPFLIFFFLLYLGVSILFTSKQPFEVRAFIDSTLVFGLPLVAFSLQASMVKQYEYGVFYSAMVVGSLYLTLFRLLSPRVKMQMLAEAFRAIAVVFYTVAIPYALDDRMTGALWALEGAAVIWISLKYRKHYGVIFGMVLELVSNVLYLLSTVGLSAEFAFANGIFAGYAVVVTAALFTAYRLRAHPGGEPGTLTQAFSMIFLGTGLLMWLLAGFLEAGRSSFETGNVLLIYAALSAVLFAAAAIRFAWAELGGVLQYYLPLGIAIFATLLHHFIAAHPFAGIGSIAIVLFFTVHYGLLWRFGSDWKLGALLHVAGMVLLVLILSRELQYAVETWTGITELGHGAFGVMPILTLLLLVQSDRYYPSLIREYLTVYRLAGGIALSTIVGIWELKISALDGAVPFMPYIPLLSPLDLLQAAGLAVFVYWLYRVERITAAADRFAFKAAGIAAFLLATLLLGRAVHFYGDVGYTTYALAASLLFQASLSILWSCMGIAAMLVGKVRGERTVWLAGAGVLGVVVLKLFLVDLAGSGTVERIVSFISVGVLLLLVGYFAPIPPSKDGAAEQTGA